MASSLISSFSRPLPHIFRFNNLEEVYFRKQYGKSRKYLFTRPFPLKYLLFNSKAGWVCKNLKILVANSNVVQIADDFFEMYIFCSDRTLLKSAQLRPSDVINIIQEQVGFFKKEVRRGQHHYFQIVYRL